MNEEMKAPAPAAGEAVAWKYVRATSDLRESHETLRPVRLPESARRGYHEIPLYAAPQPPATGGKYSALANHSPDAGAVGEEAAKIGEILVMEADIDDDDPRLPRIVSAILAALRPADAEGGE